MSEMYDVDLAIANLIRLLEEHAPELAEVLREARESGTEPHVTIGIALRLIQERPELSKTLTEMAMKAFAPLRETTDIDKVEPPEEVPAVVHPETGLPKLNPILAANIAERVQFDGDVPELRTGPMAEGMTPAVPVDTAARNPVALGDMLNRASQDVEEEQRALFHETAALLADPHAAEKLYAQASEEIALREDMTALDFLNSTMVELDGYRRGGVPALRSVPEPTGAALSRFTPEQEREAAWKFVSTTQGRRTALGALSDIVLQGLKAEEGLDVALSEKPPRRGAEVLAHSSWSVQISGAQSTQPRFSFIDTAAEALVQGLLEGYSGRDPVLLEVTTVDTVDVRRVGWAARLVPREG